ncbi:response regulator [Azospirillum sp. ST 5-10]|uniref:response regulator n=1 Tax=unclassified Azospirillum TaxID=2630922 RepID=UPI003F4A42F3
MHRPSPASRLHILIVEDNPLLLRGLCDMLGLWDRATVRTATDGAEAKALLRVEPFDAVLTDWAMAPLGGAALLRWIRESADSPRPDLPVVVLTGHADVATVRAAWDAGADAVLAKPAAAGDIAKRLETVVERPRHRTPRPPAMAGADRPAAADPSPFPSPFPALGSTGAAPLPPPGTGAGARRLPPPGRSSPTWQRRLRLLVALDRLEALALAPATDRNRLRDAAAEVRRAADGPATAELASSLAACVLEVRPDAEGFAETVVAHVGALRWALTGQQGGADVRRNLLECLRATVRALAQRRTAAEERQPGRRDPDGADYPYPT